MIDQKTQHFELPLPYLTNSLKIDVERVRLALSILDEHLKITKDTALSALTHAGDWDAATNTPAIPAASSANKGDFYIVSVDGATEVDGITRWVKDDWVVSVGTKWVRVHPGDVFDASAIRSGVLDAERIPEIPQSKVTGLAASLKSEIPISQVTNLQAALDGKQAALGYTPVNQAAPVLTGTTTIQTASPQINMYDTDWGYRYLHCNTGLIGFLNNGGGWACYSDNAGNFIATANIGAYSDRKHKKDISTITDAVGLVAQLRGVRYTDRRSGQLRVGVIAQEVQEVLPEVVGEGPDGLHVDYGNIVGPLIEAIKEIDTRLKALEGR